MKKILSLCILWTLLSCEGIHYDGEKKLVIKGSIVDENNQPIANNDVKLIVTSYGGSGYFYGFNSSDTNYIGRATSKADGSYVMVIPEPSNFAQIIVETNSEGNSLNQKQFVNIQLANFVDFELNLPQTKLYQNADLSTLIITTNQVNLNYQLQKIEYIGAVANEHEAINPYEELDFYFENNVKVKKNQTLIIHYTVKNLNTNEILVFDENVVITTDEETTYTLNY